MRSAAAVVCSIAIVACGPVDQSGSPSLGGSDAGPVAAVDAGPVAATDAGSVASGGGGGGAAGGADAGPAAAAPCDGVMPAALGTAQAATVPHGKGDVCWYFTGDLAGNVAAESHAGSSGNAFAGNWSVWAAGGDRRGGFSGVGGDVYGQAAGFESTRNSGSNALVLWSADGKDLRETQLDQGGCTALAFYASGGGTLVLDACPGSLSAFRFDGQGAPLASESIGPFTKSAGIVDAQGRTLILVAPGSAAGVQSAYAARWYDASLSALTPFFAAPGSSGQVLIRPLAGGGAALQVGGDWTGVSQSGTAGFAAPPGWLASHRNYDLQIIRGGTAYALIPRSGASPRDALDLVSAGGDRCGSLTFPVGGLSIGPDGTVIASAGDDGCSMSWWSALLK